MTKTNRWLVLLLTILMASPNRGVYASELTDGFSFIEDASAEMSEIEIEDNQREDAGQSSVVETINGVVKEHSVNKFESTKEESDVSGSRETLLSDGLETEEILGDDESDELKIANASFATLPSNDQLYKERVTAIEGVVATSAKPYIVLELSPSKTGNYEFVFAGSQNGYYCKGFSSYESFIKDNYFYQRKVSRAADYLFLEKGSIYFFVFQASQPATFIKCIPNCFYQTDAATKISLDNAAQFKFVKRGYLYYPTGLDTEPSEETEVVGDKVFTFTSDEYCGYTIDVYKGGELIDPYSDGVAYEVRVIKEFENRKALLATTYGTLGSKGVTCYIYLHDYSGKLAGQECSIIIRKSKKVSNLSGFDITSLRDHYFIKDVQTIEGLQFRINATYDGKERSFTGVLAKSLNPIRNECNYFYLDSDHNNYYLEIFDRNGKKITFDGVDTLSTGTYTARLNCGDIVSNSYSFEVGSDFSRIEQISEGRKVSLTNGEEYYIYKPTKTGKVSVKGFENIAKSEYFYSCDCVSDTPYTRTFSVVKGKTYLLCFKIYNYSNPTISIQIESSLTTTTITGLYNSTKGADIRWKAVAEATGYEVYRKRGGEGTTKVATITNANTTQCYDSGIKDNCWGRVYNYYVVPVAGATTGPKSDDVVLQRLAPMTLTSVKNSAAGKAAVTWKCSVNSNKANGYELQYAQSQADLSGRQGTYKAVTINGRNNLNKTISGLSKGKTYYFRIRCYVNYTNSKTGKMTKTWSQYSSVMSLSITK